MKTSHPAYNRILLTRMKFIGDVILTTPVIRSVRNAFPDAYIAYLGDKNAVSLLEHNPSLNEIIPFDFSKPTLFEQPRIVRLLRKRKLDLAIDLFGNPRSALLTYLSGATTRVGPARKSRGGLYTIQVPDDGKLKTAIEFHNQYITAAGIGPTSRRTEIFLTEDEKRDAEIYLGSLLTGASLLDRNRPIVGIHPGATWPAKRWLPERFAELADLVAARFGAQVIFTAGPNDQEALDAVGRATSARIRVVENLPLRKLAAVLSQCSAYVANDNGTMHIAVAVGTPTVGIFGPGEENIWFPYSQDEGHTTLRKDVPCHPCHLDFCDRHDHGFMECMKLLRVQDVCNAVQRALELPGRRSRDSMH